MLEALTAAKECTGERPRSRNGVASRETLYNIEESRVARLGGDSKRYRTHKGLEPFLTSDRDSNVRSLVEDIDGCLNASELRPALKKLHSKFTSHTNTIQTSDR